FQMRSTTTIPQAVSAGPVWGSTTRRKVPKGEEPSIDAASSSSWGRDWWKEVRMKVTSGSSIATYTSTRPVRESSSEAQASTSNSGTTRANGGTIIAAMKIAIITERPGKATRAKM